MEGYESIGFSDMLLEWYDAHRRHLPWREEPTPYRVWVSEIMLQQTRVETVIDYFKHFMECFPTVKSLADAEEDRLLKVWEGLGYYSRARNLQKTAKILMECYDGRLPETREELLRLPGIGSYTAGAISAFAYGKPEPAVDGNVMRVLARLKDCHEDILLDRTRKTMEAWTREEIPEERPGDFGQALIELGALVCSPGTPNCLECPLVGLCLGRLHGKESLLPVRENKTKKRTEKRVVLVIKAGDRYVVRKRSSEKLLHNLFEFPNQRGEFEADDIPGLLPAAMVSSVASVRCLGEAKHIFSHLIWEMTGYEILLDTLPEAEGFLWATSSELRERYALPSAFQAFLPFQE